MNDEEPMLTPSTIPNHTVKFHDEDGTVVGKLVFTGDADESAKVFVDWVMHYFDERLKQERERCAKLAEGGRFLHDDAPAARFGRECAAAIRGLK